VTFAAALVKDAAYYWAVPNNKQENGMSREMPPFRTGKRRSTRTVSVVPVRLWIAGSEDSHAAHTVDASRQGVQFGGCQGEFKVGDKIEVLYRHYHTRARVVWIIACEGSSEKRIGTEFLEPEKQPSGVDSPEQADEYEERD
jgi:hypothetical protein